MASVSLRLDDDVAARLQQLDDIEDLYLAEQVDLRVRAGTKRVYTLAEVEKELDLAD